jgi:hypothetical protein
MGKVQRSFQHSKIWLFFIQIVKEKIFQTSYTTKFNETFQLSEVTQPCSEYQSKDTTFPTKP